MPADRGRIVACLLIAACGLLAAGNTSFDALYEANQWFQLREAVRADKDAPAFYRGVVGLAFHDWDQAERNLRTAADSAPKSVTVDTMDQASQAALAMEALSDLYSLEGRYKDAAAQFDRFVNYVSSLGQESARIAKQAYRALRSYRALYSALARYPDQVVSSRGYSRMLYSASYGRPIVRVSIGRNSSSLLFDTGSGANFINPSEAKRLGLTVHAAQVPLEAYDGAKEKTRGVAVADEVTIGNFHLRNVAFFVLSEDDPDTPGILGLPLLFALGTIRWSSDGTLELGFPSPEAGPPANLAYNGGGVVTEAALGGEKLMLSVDTGTDETLVHPTFAKVIGGLMGTPVGKELDRNGLAARDLKFRVGGFEAAFGAGNPVLTKRTDDFDALDGNLGLDILGQGSSLTLDFTTMRLSVEAGAGHGGYIAGIPARCALPPGFVCQEGYTCTVWLARDDRCVVDRVAGGAGKTPDSCIIPPSFTCGRSEICVVSAGPNGICEIARSVANSEPAATPAGDSGDKAASVNAASPALRSAALTDAELRERLKKSVEEDNLNFEPSRNYVYTELKETRFLDAKGNVTDSSSETHESLVLYGERYERLTQKDGKPLTEKQQRSEQEKLDKESRKRKQESADARSKRLAAANKKDVTCNGEFIDAFQFRLLGAETVNGRPAWKVDANPIAGGSPHCEGVKKIKLFHLTIWLDQVDNKWSKLQADNIAPVTWGAILMRAPTGALHVNFEPTRRDDGAWLPAYLRVRIDLKLILLKTIRLEIVQSYSDYRKFQAESKMIL